MTSMAKLKRWKPSSPYLAALKAALLKRGRIIAREGDPDGRRRSPSYLKALIREELRAQSAEAFTWDLFQQKRLKGG